MHYDELLQIHRQFQLQIDALTKRIEVLENKFVIPVRSQRIHVIGDKSTHKFELRNIISEFIILIKGVDKNINERMALDLNAGEIPSARIYLTYESEGRWDYNIDYDTIKSLIDEQDDIPLFIVALR